MFQACCFRLCFLAFVFFFILLLLVFLHYFIFFFRLVTFMFFFYFIFVVVVVLYICVYNISVFLFPPRHVHVAKCMMLFSMLHFSYFFFPSERYFPQRSLADCQPSLPYSSIFLLNVIFRNVHLQNISRSLPYPSPFTSHPSHTHP